jgi:hypothetical protein
MARKPKADGIGHNSGEPLTDDDIRALSQHHALKIIKAERTAANIKGDYDEARGEVKAAFALVKADLGYTRKDFEEILAKMRMGEAEFRISETKRVRRFALAGLPVEGQMDLFAAPTDTADERVQTEAEGYRAGRRADDPTVPANIAPILAPDWLKGWHAGQEDNGRDFIRANEIIDARKAKAVALDPVEEDTGDVDPEDALDDAARKLKRTGWAEPTEAEAEFEAA